MDSKIEQALKKIDELEVNLEEDEDSLSLHASPSGEWSTDEYTKLTNHLNKVTSINDIDQIDAKFVFWISLGLSEDSLKQDIASIGLPGLYKLYLETEDESKLRWQLSIPDRLEENKQ